MTWQQWLSQAIIRLHSVLNHSARRDAEILLLHVVGEIYTRLLVCNETQLTDLQLATLEVLLSRREKGEPIAYLIGECEFWTLNLRISVETLIPRSSTECLVERALKLLPQDCAKVLDLGSGSGAIALALASERPEWDITGIDNLPGAVALARTNAAILRLKNIQFYKGNWFEQLQKQRYNLIVSNPPYISKNDPHLMQGDLRFEPRSALVGGIDGLEYLTVICREASIHLLRGGWLVVEHGWCQGADVRTLLASAKFHNITTLRDYDGHERISQGQWW